MRSIAFNPQTTQTGMGCSSSKEAGSSQPVGQQHVIKAPAEAHVPSVKPPPAQPTSNGFKNDVVANTTLPHVQLQNHAGTTVKVNACPFGHGSVGGGPFPGYVHGQAAVCAEGCRCQGQGLRRSACHLEYSLDATTSHTNLLHNAYKHAANTSIPPLPPPTACWHSPRMLLIACPLPTCTDRKPTWARMATVMKRSCRPWSGRQWNTRCVAVHQGRHHNLKCCTCIV